MSIKIFEQYAELQTKVKELEIEKKKLSVKCLEEMRGEKEDKRKTDYGTFSVVTRYSWKYTNKVKEMEKAVREHKALEQEAGTAKSKSSKSLRFDFKRIG